MASENALSGRVAADSSSPGVHERCTGGSCPLASLREHERQKRLARIAAQDEWAGSLQRFLEVVNDGRTRVGSVLPWQFDAKRKPAHASLTHNLQWLAGELRLVSRGSSETENKRLSEILDRYRGVFELLRYIEADAAAVMLSVEVEFLLRRFFIQLGGFRVLERCENDSCGRYFVAWDDRQRFCQPVCRSSRQALSRTERSRRFRRRNT